MAEDACNPSNLGGRGIKSTSSRPARTKSQKQNAIERAGGIANMARALAYHIRGPGFNLQYHNKLINREHCQK
jgi:hypothetical protein